MSLDSEPGKGCTAALQIPVGVAREKPKTSVLVPPGQDTVATEVVSVLVCDDDEDMRALLEHYLHRAGYGLITAANSAEALEKGMSLRPDIVLMDVNLHEGNGVDTARVLRERGYEGPVVALTATKLSDEEQGAFTRCFRKPAEMPELLGAIKDLTHGRGTA